MHPHMPWRKRGPDIDEGSVAEGTPAKIGADASGGTQQPRQLSAVARTRASSGDTAATPEATAKSPVSASLGSSRDTGGTEHTKPSPKHRVIPWNRTPSMSNAAASGTAATPTVAPVKRDQIEGPSIGASQPGTSTAIHRGSASLHRSTSSRSTLPPSSSSETETQASPPERLRRPRPGERRKPSFEDRSKALVVSSGPPPPPASHAPDPNRPGAGTSNAHGSKGGRPGYISRRGSNQARGPNVGAAAGAAGAAAAVSPRGASQRRRLSAMPEKGESSGSSLGSRDSSGGNLAGMEGGSGENVARRGSAAVGGRRGEKKEVARSDRRRGRASVEAARRITHGDVSYQIGQEIGRGGFGTVFQALNTATGDFVAVKRMEMDSVQLDAGASIKGEIDLLKKLNHPNIVQYIDTIQTEGHLHIVLEIMESSLSAMCKKFGNFSESLTAIYMTQVLEGLKYLHDQGVLHRDIKGANILTTKHGLVKLADFGVAMKLSDKQDFESDVAGTPYWMAPEIIEMTGTTTACDVWSVGCTIIELLEGKPPYFDLPQMTALYKIVQDDHPPMPDGVSQALRDFLLQCFKKQAQMRKSAVELLRHPWLKNPTNHLRKTMKVENVELNPGEDDTQRRAVLKTVRTAAQLMQARSPKRRYHLSENDVRDITSIANLDEAAASSSPREAKAVPGSGDGGVPSPAKASSSVGSKSGSSTNSSSSSGSGLRRGNIPPPAAALAAAKRRTGTPGGEEGQDWDQDWDRELGLVMPSLPETRPSFAGGEDARSKPLKLMSIAPASEEAKQRLRAMKGAEESAQNQPLLLETLDANALDDWGDDEDEGEDGFASAFKGAGSGDRITSGSSLASGWGGFAGGGMFESNGGGAGMRLMGLGGGVSTGGRVESFEHNSDSTRAGELGAGGQGGVTGMQDTVLRRFMEDDFDDHDDDAFGEVDMSEERPMSLVMNGQESSSGFFGEEEENASSFAENLKARMMSHQGNAAAAAAAAAAAGDDGFDDLFGDGFEELTDGEETETGEKAEQEVHAKVGQEVFAELSSLEARGACTTSGKTTGCHINHSNNIQQTQAIASAILPSGGRTVGSTGPRRFDGGNLTTLDALNLDRVVLEGVLEEGVPAPKVLTFEERIVEACVRVCEKLERCREARHYVMSADRGVTPLMYLMQAVKPDDERGEEAMAHILAVMNKIVEDNLKALESLAVVGLVPKVIAILEKRGAWELDKREREGPLLKEGVVGGGALKKSQSDGVVLERRGSSGAGGPKMRVEAARLVRALCYGSDLTLQTLISCGGLAVLTQFLDAGPRIDGPGEAGIDARRLVRIGIDGVLKVFSLQRIRRNDFCKLFLRLGLMSRIMDTFTRFLGHTMAAASPSGHRKGLLEREASVAVMRAAGSGMGAVGTGAPGGGADLFWPYLTRAAEILTTFSKSDSVVKEGVAEEQCLEGIMSALSSVCPDFLNVPKFCSLAVTLLTVLKNISMEPSTLEALDKAGAITTLVSMLGREPQGSHRGGGGVKGGDEDLENQVLQCMFYLCRISRKRQEKAAVAGLIPHLRRCVLKESRLKQFALQMVCDFAHTSALVRGLMWDEGVMDFYLSIMRSAKDRHWHVTIFRSLCAWLSSEGETDRVAQKLVEPPNLEKVISLFCTARQVEFEEVVDKLYLMMDRSLALVKALGSSAVFILEVTERLHYPKAVVGKTLLGMLRQIHLHHPQPAALVRDFDLYRIVLTLSRNEAQVLVAELAAQLLQDFDEHKSEGAGVRSE